MKRVATFPSHVSFVDALSLYLSENFGSDPESLSQLRLFLPSRRSSLALREAFLRLRNGKPCLLPRVLPLGDVEEDLLISEAWGDAPELAKKLASLPPIMGRMQRQVMLAELLTETGLVPQAGEQALHLAAELARLLDDMQREGVSFEHFHTLVPEEFAEHWGITLRYFDIIESHWAKKCAESGRMEPVARRNATLKALTDYWQQHPPSYPVIAAGSTGSQAATSALLEVIAGLPRGEVILPGLDQTLNEEAWQEAGRTETHAQFGLFQLLKRIDVTREDVIEHPVSVSVTACAPGRIDTLRQAMWPASVTAQWREETADNTLDHVEVMEAETLRQEATAIALRLRDALESPETRAAVVTHDRELARMISGEMQRFGVQIDDSAGQPLLQTPGGAFLSLVADLAQNPGAPLALLSLLKHPMAALGMNPAECRRNARQLEILLLRGVRGEGGLEGLIHSLKAREKNKDIAAPLKLLIALQAAIGEFVVLMRHHQASFRDLHAAHIAAAEAIAATSESSGAAIIFTGDSGRLLAKKLNELALVASVAMPVMPSHYPGMVQQLLGAEIVRSAYGGHPRVRILSPLEARLQQVNVLILAGLNEGSWPPTPSPSAWMSRPMLRQAGLPAPERAIGLAAHDFIMLSNAKTVIYSRAKKTGGTETEPCRWLQRLQALLSLKQGKLMPWPEHPFVHAAREMLQVQAEILPLKRPAPAPPRALRPATLRVTEIETLQDNPYAIYAKYILGLRPLEPLDEEPSSRHFGTVVHEILCRFSQQPQTVDIVAVLHEAADQEMQKFAHQPSVVAYWKPRFEACIDWLAAQEYSRRVQSDKMEVVPECPGNAIFRHEGQELTLKTRLDRLECLPGEKAAIIDYKTGGMATPGEVAKGRKLQLPLEAWIVEQGGMDGLPAQRVEELHYWKLAGAKSESSTIAGNEDKAQSLIVIAQEILKALIEAYWLEEKPYLVWPDAKARKDRRFDDYDHLARLEEWS